MTEIKIIFVRHGEAASAYGDHEDPGLSKKGLSQSNDLLRNNKLQNLEEYTFISSPKLRAIETAGPLARKFNKEILIDDIFIEIPSKDIQINKKQQWLKQLVDTKIKDLPENVKLWVNNILKRTSGIREHSIIFTHFMVMNALLGQLTKSEKLLCFYPDYTSILEIEVKEGKIKSFSKKNSKKTYINL